MLHDTRDKYVISITYSIDLDLFTHDVLIYKYWVLLGMSVDDIHELYDILIRDCDLHSLSTENV